MTGDQGNSEKYRVQKFIAIKCTIHIIFTQNSFKNISKQNLKTFKNSKIQEIKNSYKCIIIYSKIFNKT